MPIAKIVGNVSSKDKLLVGFTHLPMYRSLMDIPLNEKKPVLVSGESSRNATEIILENIKIKVIKYFPNF